MAKGFKCDGGGRRIRLEGQNLLAAGIRISSSSTLSLFLEGIVLLGGTISVRGSKKKVLSVSGASKENGVLSLSTHFLIGARSVDVEGSSSISMSEREDMVTK